MPLDFPNSPAVNDTWTASNGVTYVWDGTKWVSGTIANAYAPIASPTFTGDPRGPTPPPGDTDTSLATTAFVATAVLQAPFAPAGAINDVGRNLIHNPLFNVAQRGNGPFSTTAYSLDRWLLVVTNDTANASRAANTTAMGGDEAASWVAGMIFTGNAAAASVTRLAQPIEDVRRLSNKTVTVSFWAYASATQKLGVSIDQYFGTGGSPSAQVQGTGQAVQLSSTWTRYSLTFNVPSVSGKTPGSNNDHATFCNFWYSSGATNNTNAGNIGVQNGTILLWGVQLEIGSVATPLEKPDPQQDLAKCQRFYQTGQIYAAANAPVATSQYSSSTALTQPMHHVPTVAVLSTTGSTNLSGITVGTLGSVAVQASGSVVGSGLQTALNVGFSASADL